MKRQRTKCPDDFSAVSVVRCLEAAAPALAGPIEELKKGKPFINYDHSAAGQDRSTMFVFRDLLKNLLLANSSGVFKKSILADGLAEWSKDFWQPLHHRQSPHLLEGSSLQLAGHAIKHQGHVQEHHSWCQDSLLDI